MTKEKFDSLPLFTVIIPVKNRAAYLYHTLRTCMMQEYKNIEIIVSDDASDDDTSKVVKDAMQIDPRIKYYFHNPGLGMRDNFEFALSKVKSGYVIALGGDDGLLPNGIQGMYEVLQKTDMEMLAWPAPLFSFPNKLGEDGQLLIYHKKGIKIIKSDEFLNRQATQLSYLSDIESPMFYVKGVVSTRLIDKVKERSKEGRFYSCPTPDGYSGIVLAGEVDAYAFSSEPFSIYGMSNASQGLAYLSNDKQAIKKSEKFFNDNSLQPMHAELASQPYSPLISLMTVDYLLTANDLPGWKGEFPSINYKQLLTKALNELAHGLYGENRILRELKILNKIAKKHGLEKYLKEIVKKTKRFKKKNPFRGNGINANAFLLDPKPYNIKNIYDAAYVAKSLYNAYSEISPRFFMDMTFNSFLYRFQSLQKGNSFPLESEWDN